MSARAPTRRRQIRAHGARRILEHGMCYHPYRYGREHIEPPVKRRGTDGLHQPVCMCTRHRRRIGIRAAEQTVFAVQDVLGSSVARLGGSAGERPRTGARDGCSLHGASGVVHCHDVGREQQCDDAEPKANSPCCRSEPSLAWTLRGLQPVGGGNGLAAPTPNVALIQSITSTPRTLSAPQIANRTRSPTAEIPMASAV